MKAIRLLSVFLAACFLLCMLPAKAEAETATTVTKATVVSRLNYLINKLNGKFFTVTGEPCNKPAVSGHACENCRLFNVTQAKWFQDLIDKYPNENPSVTHHYYSSSLTNGRSCCGFANFVAWYLFTNSTSDSISLKKVGTGTMTYQTLQTLNAQPGDILRRGSSTSGDGDHSMVLVSYDENGYTILESNGYATNKAAGNCLVEKETVSYKEASYVTVSRAANYDYSSTDSLATSTYTNAVVKAAYSGNVKAAPYADAETLDSYSVGDTFTIGAYGTNKYDNIWYQILSGPCAGGYVFSGDMTLQEYVDDVTFTKKGTLPSSYIAGNYQQAKEEITSRHKLTSVTASILQGGTVLYTATTSPNTNGTFSIYVPAIDNAMKFAKLSAGDYTFKVTATVTATLDSQEKDSTAGTGQFCYAEKTFTEVYTYNFKVLPAGSVTVIYGDPSSTYASKYGFINDTNAGIVHSVVKPSGTTVSAQGMYLYDANKDTLKSCSYGSSTSASTTSYHMWFDVQDEVGYTLTPGTQYYYRFFVVINGTTHWSDMYSFTTTGHSHSYGNWLHNGTQHWKACSCGATTGTANHTWNSGVITTQPTATAAGIKTYTCTTCNRTKTESVSATGYTLTVKSADTSMGTVTGGGNYAAGSSVTIKATPLSGYEFVSWNDGSTSPSRSITVNANVTYTATFKKEAPKDAATFSIAHVTGRPGQTVDVTVSLENNPDIAAFCVEIGFDNTIVTPVSVTVNTELIPSVVTNIGNSNVSSSISIVYSDATGFTGNGVLFTVSFAIAENAGEGRTVLNCTIGEEDVVGNGTVSEFVTAIGNNGSIDVKKNILYGDCNLDGKVNILDSVFLDRYFAKWDLGVTEENMLTMDTNGDGKVNILDSVLLKRYFAKWEVTLGPQE